MADPFKLQIDKIARRYEARAGTVLRAVALETLSRIVQRTPVDTGRARGGWTVAVNAKPANSTALDKGGAATISKASAIISHAKSGDTVTIRNTVPYILRLEYGWSQQAPSGFVRLTLAGMRSAIHAAAARARREG